MFVAYFLPALMVSIHNILSTHKEISFFSFLFFGLVSSRTLFLNFMSLSLLTIILLSVLCRIYIIYISICAFIFFCNNYKYSIHLFSNTLIHMKPPHTSNELFFLCFIVFSIPFLLSLSFVLFALNSLSLSF